MEFKVFQPIDLIPLDICISAGHSNNPKRDRGASGNGYIEGELAVLMRDKLITNINRLGYRVLADGDDTILSESLQFFKGKVTNKSIVIDIHFNSASPQAKGTETLIPTNFTQTELDLAFNTSKIINEVCGFQLRGFTANKQGVRTEAESHHGKLGWMRLVGYTILLEVCFISNKDEMKVFIDKIDILCERLAKYYVTQALKIDSGVSDTNTVHIVKSGETLGSIAKKYNTTIDKLQLLNGIKNASMIQVNQRLKIK